MDYCDKIEIDEILRIDIPISANSSYIIDYIFHDDGTMTVKYMQVLYDFTHSDRDKVNTEGVQEFDKDGNVCEIGIELKGEL